jgi:hypothetical protein
MVLGEMDATGYVLIVGAVSAALVAVVAAVGKVLVEMRSLRAAQKVNRAEIKENKEDIDVIKAGAVRRGYLEAFALKLMHRDPETGKITIEERARERFAEIHGDLKELRKELREAVGQDLTNEELGWAIERRFQMWLIDHVCKPLNLKQWACVALSVELARENGDH